MPKYDPGHVAVDEWGSRMGGSGLALRLFEARVRAHEELRRSGAGFGHPFTLERTRNQALAALANHDARALCEFLNDAEGKE